MQGCPKTAISNSAYGSRIPTPSESEIKWSAPWKKKSAAIRKSISPWRSRRASRSTRGRKENGVPERTAFHWAKDPTVRREVDACRRRALNQAIGRLTGMATNAVDGIANLAKGADSKSVQLRAWQGVLADLMSVSKFSVLEYRMTEIEEQLLERTQLRPPSTNRHPPSPIE